jgi:hypothetical protein
MQDFLFISGKVMHTRNARRILDTKITFAVGPSETTENHRNVRSQELSAAYFFLACSPAFKCAKRSRDGDVWRYSDTAQ